jgi:hypothetical protein
MVQQRLRLPRWRLRPVSRCELGIAGGFSGHISRHEAMCARSSRADQEEHDCIFIFKCLEAVKS